MTNLFNAIQEAKVLASRGMFKEAFQILGQVEQVALKNNRYIELLTIYNVSGNILYCYMGKYQEAKVTFERAIKSLPDTSKQDSQNPSYISSMASIYDNIGNVLGYMGSARALLIVYLPS